MKKILTAALALSFLSAGGAIFAQNTSTSTDTGSMKSTKKSKHHKSKKTDTTATTSTTK